jgi:trimethylamine--corrinoid protein Co-methyltransferase
MITDLRTGGMAGGSGEQALLTAAAVELGQYYNFPNSTISGATDSKLPDNQAGFEKALNLTLAVQTGANLITQAAGTQAGLMATSFEAYVIDNEMLGAILSSGKQIEVSEASLSLQAIQKVVEGEGHFLGQSETFKRMSTDFLYPENADRQAYETWVANGQPNINSNAKIKVDELLNVHRPKYIPKDLDNHIRKLFDIMISI